MRTCLMVLVGFLLPGCGLLQRAFPNDPQWYSADWDAKVSVLGAPPDSLLYVDGEKMGIADQFDGDPEFLRLYPGIHQISVVKEGTVLFRREIALGNAPKKIRVHSP